MFNKFFILICSFTVKAESSEEGMLTDGAYSCHTQESLRLSFLQILHIISGAQPLPFFALALVRPLKGVAAVCSHACMPPSLLNTLFEPKLACPV